LKTTVYIAYLFLCSLNTCAQESIFTDQRDGKKYPVITLGTLQWFKSNLSYETKTSWCAQHGKGANCNDGNFYYYNNLDSVCPQGWRVPTWADWESTMKVIIDKHHIHPDSVKYKKGVNRGAVIVNGINVIDDTLGLNVKPIGWVEGNKRESQNEGQANFFILDDEKKDPTTHLHIVKGGYTKHGHDDNIIDKPKKTRRLSVRCVKNN